MLDAIHMALLARKRFDPLPALKSEHVKFSGRARPEAKGMGSRCCYGNVSIS